MLCMYVYDVCVVFYDCLVGEIHVVIQKKKKKDVKSKAYQRIGV